jgi:haloalkane dehalogenase
MVALPLISEVLRTPEDCFFNLPDYPFAAHYTELGGLRIAHVDEGPRDGPIVLLMHGEPAWSYLYRKMIPVLVSAGLRVIAPDLVGFGRSDKPAHANSST